MPLKFDFCPYCQRKIVFNLTEADIDTAHYPSPIYIHHTDKTCNKTSTFYVDSLLRVSYKELEKKESITGNKVKTVNTIGTR